MKRAFDVVAAILILLLTAPIFVIVAVLVRLKLGSPVLFRQVRPGQDGKPFPLYKFRTMQDATDSDGTPLSDGERLTKFGRLLRRSSIDELPELWNILRGDMSFVGPRPLLMKYLPYYTEHEQKRHSIRPGITGLAQISGRNFLAWDERLAKDVEYVESQSMWLDLKILWKTVTKVIAGDGVAPDSRAVMKDLDDERRSSTIDSQT